MSSESLDSIDAKLSEMLTNSMRIYDLAMNCLLGDTNLDSVRDDLYSTDKKINELHRDVRREMIIHSAVNSRNLDIPLLLSYMTCLLYTSPSPRDATLSRMPSSA